MPEAVVDFMFWRSAKHKFGWYLEPTYEYNFGRGHEQSLGITAGQLIPMTYNSGFKLASKVCVYSNPMTF